LKIFFLSILSFLLHGILFSQILPPKFEINEDVIVIEDGDTLKFPFFGGLNNPQFNAIDLNEDEIKDMVIFDKTNDRVYTFLNEGIANEISYTYNNFYEQFFPLDLRDFLILIDYNNDNIEDIFTFTSSGIKVYKTSYVNNHIEFQLVRDKLFYTSTSGNPTNVYCSAVDVPGIIDVNGDGDIDILNFGLLGSTLVYYENQSIENGHDFDSLYYEIATTCWGDFSENGSNSGLNLDVFCQPILDSENQNENTNIHAGSTILAFDYDFDNDVDILVGDVSSKNLSLLINGGDNTYAHIDTVLSNFPINTTPIDVFVFPAAFLMDINNDGIKDLLSAPTETFLFENTNQVSFYKGITNSNNHEFEFVQDDFLVGEMIDVGTTAVPHIIDFNADGKKDILIGNYAYSDTSAYDGIFQNTLTAYENIGDSANLVFELIDRDFNNLSQHLFFGIYPVFEDFNKDGDVDMLTISFDGKLHYFRNFAVPGNPLNLILTASNLNNINIGGGSQPLSCLYDYNNDSLPDLVVGERSGTLNLLENVSMGNYVAFQEIDNFWGGVNVSVVPSPSGYAAPFVCKLDSSHQDYLIVHNVNGTLNLYNNLTQPTFTKLDTFFSEFNSGGLGGIFIEDINGDNFQDLLVGNKRGGLHFLTQIEKYFPIDTATIDTNVNIIEHTDYFSNKLKIFPNPLSNNQNLKIEFKEAFSGTLTIFTSKGQKYFSQKYYNQLQIGIDNNLLKTGINYLVIHQNSESIVKRVLITK